MAFGLIIYNSDGSVNIDTTTYGGVFLGFVTVPGSTGATVSYPLFPGRTVAAINLNGVLATGWTTNYSPTVDYSAGYPIITWPSATPYAVTYAVFAF